MNAAAGCAEAHHAARAEGFRPLLRARGFGRAEAPGAVVYFHDCLAAGYRAATIGAGPMRVKTGACDNRRYIARADTPGGAAMKIVRVRAIPMSDPVPPRAAASHRSRHEGEKRCDADPRRDRQRADRHGRGARHAAGRRRRSSSTSSRRKSSAKTRSSPSASTKRCTTARAPSPRSSAACRSPR